MQPTELYLYCNMTIKAVCPAIVLSAIIALLYETSCHTTSIIPACVNVTIPPYGMPGKNILCLKDSCTENCVCTSSSDFDVCHKSMVCHTNSSCYQIAPPPSIVPYLYCFSHKECKQNISDASSLQMIAESNLTNQIYKADSMMLNEMVCNSTPSGGGVCNQTCELCNSTTCSANSCRINCTDCHHMTCGGGPLCKSFCNKQCNTTICESSNCSMVCEAKSKCNNVECRGGVNDCSLQCRSGAVCSLYCSDASKCSHSCALDGLCYTRGPGFLDKHNGQCGLCNCTSDVRNCIQRCHSGDGHCLGLYCNASKNCEQYSKSTDASFVLFMSSTAPIGKQVCHNGSDCWHMVCYGSNCTLICERKATCGFMICKAENCSFHCKSGAICDVMTCLPGSGHCIYHCEVGANCRVERCQGDICVGAPKYVKSGAPSFREKKKFDLQLILASLVAFLTSIGPTFIWSFKFSACA